MSPVRLLGLGNEILADDAFGILVAKEAVGRKLDLDVPKETIAIAVEASDCTTVGGPIHPDVQSAIPAVVELVGRFLSNGPLDCGWRPG